MNSNSDLQIAGDILEVQHLLQPAREHPATVSEFVGLARTIAADRAQWEPLVRYDTTTRWYHRLRTGPGYEVWLLSWVPGQGSGLHDHGPSSGVLTVLEGQADRTHRARHPGPGLRRSAGLRARLCARSGQRLPRTGGQSAHLLPGTDRDADARGAVRPGGRGCRTRLTNCCACALWFW